MNTLIPLVGTAVAGAAAAAAFIAYNTVTGKRRIEEQYTELGEAAAKIPGASKNPATVLVLGFENHGRSSFINTVIRVLYKESGPLVMRAETGPSKGTTTTPRVFRVKNKISRHHKFLLNLIDVPTFSASDDVDAEALKAMLRGENLSGFPKEIKFPAAECVVLVVRSEDASYGGPACKRLPDLARVIREEGLQFVVVLTHKKEAKKASGNLQELCRNVALKTGTDFVQCIDNYGPQQCGEGPIRATLKNNLDTQRQTLSIVRQCFEYVRQRRRIADKASTANITESIETQLSYSFSLSD